MLFSARAACAHVYPEKRPSPESSCTLPFFRTGRPPKALAPAKHLSYPRSRKLHGLPHGTFPPPPPRPRSRPPPFEPRPLPPVERQARAVGSPGTLMIWTSTRRLRLRVATPFLLDGPAAPPLAVPSAERAMLLGRYPCYCRPRKPRRRCFCAVLRRRARLCRCRSWYGRSPTRRRLRPPPPPLHRTLPRLLLPVLSCRGRSAAAAFRFTRSRCRLARSSLWASSPPLSTAPAATPRGRRPPPPRRLRRRLWTGREISTSLLPCSPNGESEKGSPVLPLIPPPLPAFRPTSRADELLPPGHRRTTLTRTDTTDSTAGTCRYPRTFLGGGSTGSRERVARSRGTGRLGSAPLGRLRTTRGSAWTIWDGRCPRVLQTEEGEGGC